MKWSEFYIGIKECGCVTCVIAKGLQDYEKTLKEWKEEGMAIELVDVEEARRRLKICECSETDIKTKENKK